MKVRKTDTCWLFEGNITKGKGYGQVYLGKDKGMALAHRYSWELANGPIPDGLCCLHECDVRNCVNPDHLFLGTVKDNAEDMVKKGRQSQGEKSPHAKLTAAQLVQVKALLVQGEIQRVIGERFGVTQSAISLIKRGLNWKAAA